MSNARRSLQKLTGFTPIGYMDMRLKHGDIVRHGKVLGVITHINRRVRENETQTRLTLWTGTQAIDVNAMKVSPVPITTDLMQYFTGGEWDRNDFIIPYGENTSARLNGIAISFLEERSFLQAYLYDGGYPQYIELPFKYLHEVINLGNLLGGIYFSLHRYNEGQNEPPKQAKK